MLKLMRHHAKYFYILFFIVILSFIFWGVGTVDQEGQRAIVAEIGHYKIGYDEYAQSYDRYFKFYRNIYKDRFDEKVQEDMKDMIINLLVDDRVLLIAAESNGITVSDAELREAIINEPSFHTNGVFDNVLYQNTLRLNRVTPEAYEAQRRQELIVLKMRNLIILASPPGIYGETREGAPMDPRDTLIQSFIEGYKKKLKITINKQAIL